MRIANPRYWASLVLPFLFLLAPGVGAQGIQLPPNPPPHVAGCMETMTALGNFVVMRRAGITKEETVEMFRISLKLTKYLLKQQQNPPTSQEKIEAQRVAIDMVYDLPEQVLNLDEALTVWMRGTMQKCVNDNAPNANRMIPS